jgi:hypothetical protein
MVFIVRCTPLNAARLSGRRARPPKGGLAVCARGGIYRAPSRAELLQRHRLTRRGYPGGRILRFGYPALQLVDSAGIRRVGAEEFGS